MSKDERTEVHLGMRRVQSCDLPQCAMSHVGSMLSCVLFSPQSFGLVSKNPVLKNITDYLVEEGSYEEEALLGEAFDEKPKDGNP